MHTRELKTLYKILGLFFVGLGIVGIALPILPTTPFLLLALWFFTRSSDRLRRWLLTNRVFGRYISDFHSGNGVPRNVKIYTLALLWATILFSAFAVVDAVWVKALLLLIAGGVTWHIVNIKTKIVMRKIVVLVPTAAEAGCFGREFDVRFVEPDGWRAVKGGAVPVVVCGVGMAETAAAVVSVMKAGRPDMLVLAGSAGAYPGSGLSVGDCAVAGSERAADQGAWRDGGFVPLYRKTYVCAHADAVTALPKVCADTVNCAGARTGGGEPDGSHTAHLENMEGAAFFAVCGALGIPFLEVRAVSNMTGDPRDAWDLDAAAASLAKGLKKVMDEIKA